MKPFRDLLTKAWTPTGETVWENSFDCTMSVLENSWQRTAQDEATRSHLPVAVEVGGPFFLDDIKLNRILILIMKQKRKIPMGRKTISREAMSREAIYAKSSIYVHILLHGRRKMCNTASLYIQKKYVL